MKMTASFLALACAATLPLASVAHAATSESATTVSAAQSQTILEVSASGKLSEIGAAVLGPDVRLTVRLHGPIAFDVDTANFASLEIYADDAAATLTVSEPTAYDRLTAVSFPKATGAATTFATAAATSAGVATLADTTTDTTPRWIWTPPESPTEDQDTKDWTDPDNWDNPDAASLKQLTGARYPQKQGGWGATGDSASTINAMAWQPIEIAGTAEAPLELTTAAGIEGWNFRLHLSYATLNFTGNVVKFQSSTTPSTAIVLENESVFNLNATNVRFGHWQLYDVDIGDDCKFNVGSDVDETNGSYEFNVDLNSSGLMTLKSWTPQKDVELSFALSFGTRSDVQIIRERPLVTWSGDTCNLDGVAGTVTTTSEGVTPTESSSITSTMSADEVAALPVGSYNIVKSPTAKTISVLYVDYSDSVVAIDATETDALSKSSDVTAETDVVVALEDGETFTLDSPTFGSLTIDNADAAKVKLATTGIDFSKVRFTDPANLTLVLTENGPTSFVPEDLPASCNIEVATPVTLTVDSLADEPYWTVGGSLTIAEGSSLTVALAEGVEVTKPFQLVTVGTVVEGTAIQAGQADDHMKVTLVDHVYWLTGTSTIRPEQTLEGTRSWSELTWVNNDNESAELLQASSVVLTFNGAGTLTIDGAVQVGSLTVNNTSNESVEIVLGESCSLTVANQVMVVAGGVSLPIGTLFDMTTVGETSAPSAPADKPAFVVSAGATATLTGGDPDKSYIRKEPITGGGTVVKSEGISRLDLCGVSGAVPNLEDVTLRIEGGGLKLTTGDVAGSNYAVLKSATVVFAGTDPTLYMYGWACLGGEVTFVSESDTGYSFNNNDVTSFLSLENAEATLVLKRGENATEGVVLPRVVLASGVAARVESGHATINLNGSTSGPINVNGGKLTLEDPVATVPVTVASGATVSVPANAETLALGGITGKGVIEIVPGTQTGVSGFGMTGGAFKGTLCLADGVTKTQSSGSWAIPCDVELNGSSGSLTVGGTYTLSGTGTVTGTLTFSNNAKLDATGGALTATTLSLTGATQVNVLVGSNASAGMTILKHDGATVAEAKKLIVTDADNAYVTTAADNNSFLLGKVNIESLPEGSIALANILEGAQDAAVSAGATSVKLAYGQCGGKTLTAEKAEAGVQLFKNVVTTTTEGTTTTVTVAYDFGISKMAIRDIGETRYVIVGAKVQGAEDATTAADFADGTTVQVSVNGKVKTAEAVTAADVGETAEVGVKWFRLPYADVVGADTGTSSLTVKALPQATTP